MNYKIRVENEAESEECQDFAESAGYLRKYNNFTLHNGWVCLSNDGYILCVCQSQAGSELDDYKEITLADLRDLVVLKRNSIDDATHVDQYGDKWRRINNKFYFYSGVGEWDDSLSHLMNRYDLKPIEKPMKEYLRKNIDGEYVLEVTDEREAQEPHAKHWIEIPEGAEVAVYYKYKDKVFFWKDAGKTHWGESSRLQLGWHDCSANMFTRLDEFLNEWADQATVIWQRETLNDQVASAETARQSEKVLKEILEGNLPEFDFEAIDAFIESNVEQDNVNQPIHYCSHPSGIECIEITRHHDFAIGNAIKYLWRAGLKDSSNEIQDLEKSVWYIQDKINQLKKQNENSCKD